MTERAMAEDCFADMDRELSVLEGYAEFMPAYKIADKLAEIIEDASGVEMPAVREKLAATDRRRKNGNGK